jgi:hypothetical protein
MKMIFAQGTLSPSAKAYIGYSNATLNLILANEFSTAGLELRTADVIRQQIFANGNIVIDTSSQWMATRRVISAPPRETHMSDFWNTQELGIGAHPEFYSNWDNQSGWKS